MRRKYLRLLRFFDTSADGIAKIFLGNALIRFAIIRPHACAAASQLSYQTVVCRIPRDPFGELDDCFSKLRSAFLQLERTTGTLLPLASSLSR